MSWFSQFIDDPVNFVEDNPWKALGLLAAPVAAVAAPWALPELGAAAGAVGTGEAALGGAAGEGFLGSLGAAGTAAGNAVGGALTGAADAVGSLFGGIGDALSGAGSSLSGMVGGTPETLPSFAPESAIGGGDPLQAWLANPNGPAPLGDAADAYAYVPNESGAGPGIGDSGISSDPMNAASTAPSGASQPGMWDNLVNKVTSDPLKAAGIGVAGLGLGYNMLSGMNNSPNIAAMQASAGAQSAQAKQLMSYLQKGQLPPGLEGIAKTMQQSMDAQAIANAAKSGMPTDPTQNTSLAQQLSANKERVFGWIAQQGMQLLNTGVTLSGMSNTLYAQLEQLDRQKSQQTGQAIANFAAALNGGGKGTYMKVA